MGIANTAKRRARMGLTALLGILAVAVGLGFLTQAAWIYLSMRFDPVWAGQIIGGAYLLGGGALLLRADWQQRKTKPSDRAQPGVALAEAFVVGMDAGRRAGRTSATE